MLTATTKYINYNYGPENESIAGEVAVRSEKLIDFRYLMFVIFDYKSHKRLRHLFTNDCLKRSPAHQRLDPTGRQVLFIIIIPLLLPLLPVLDCLDQQVAAQSTAPKPITGDRNFTFVHNGSFLQIDAGREWPLHSRREISFRFKTKSPHGLLIYQTFDHNKLFRDEDQDGLDQGGLLIATPVHHHHQKHQPKQVQSSPVHHGIDTLQHSFDDPDSRVYLYRAARSSSTEESNLNIRHSAQPVATATLNQLSNSAITATASEKLVNSLFSSSPVAVINGNGQQNRATAGLLGAQTALRADKISTAGGSASIVTQRIGDPSNNNKRMHLTNLAIGPESSSMGIRSVSDNNVDGSTIVSSSAISSFSGSFYELYLKLENGRLKIMYEFGNKLNQTVYGRGLNDDRWHKVELRVDPDTNQMALVLDQMPVVEIARNHIQQQDTDEASNRRNELVFTNSILYIGGLDNNASLVKNLKQRLHLAQFIGCIGQIMIKTDQHAESTTMQPANIDRAVLVKKGCINLCDTDNYCLHNSTCVNYYTHTHCDCFGTNYEDVYCWREKLTTLSMFGYSTLVHRLYDWRDRHHSAQNRLSLQFRTHALDSILFFAYGDMNPVSRSSLGTIQSNISPNVLTQTALFPVAQVNISTGLPTIHRPTVPGAYPNQGNINYLAVSLTNGSVVVEVNFGDQPILLSNLLYDRIMQHFNKNNTSINKKTMNLADGQWHNLTFVHSNKMLYLYLDNYSVNSTISGKNSLLYFDPSIYIGSIPAVLFNETKSLMRPPNLRHKFVGCLKSVYFNQHNILFSLKKNSPMVEYRDLLGRPRLDVCEAQAPNSLPLTLRSGKSYLTFRLNSPPNQMMMQSALRDQQVAYPAREDSISGSAANQPIPTTTISAGNASASSTLSPSQLTRTKSQNLDPLMSMVQKQKLTKIEFEYKTARNSHFLAGGHLRDRIDHDRGGFWTLRARENCQLQITINTGPDNPDQVIKLDAINTTCAPDVWTKVSLSILSDDKLLNISRSVIPNGLDQMDHPPTDHQSSTLMSSVELLHQVQLGGDLAKYGESSSIPFSGCLRNIRISNRSFDSRDFVTKLPDQDLNQNHPSSSGGSSGSSIISSSGGGSNISSSGGNGGSNSSSSSNISNSGSSGNSISGNNGGSNNMTMANNLAASSDVISTRHAQGYITIDSCQLVNECAAFNPCKNNGQCKVNELGEPECDCSKTGYTGKRCQFSIYKQSCLDLYLSGQRKSSFYLIDLDRNGPLRPIRVKCNMEDVDNGLIETSISHNMPSEFLVPRSKPEDIALDITYHIFHHMFTNDGFYVHNDNDLVARSDQDLVLKTLIEQSLHCKQQFRYDCKSAPLHLGNKTWLEAAYPKNHIITSLDGLNYGKCECASSEKRCLDVTKNCNCDKGESYWTDDSHELTDRTEVGITRIVLLRQEPEEVDQTGMSHTGPQSRFTLSDLKCYGNKRSGSHHEITFKTSDAYIEVPGWRRGDLSFSFRTASNPPAIILFQLATSRNHGYFRLNLVTDTRLVFEYILNRRPRKLTVNSSHKLNNGEWQQVFIEYDNYNLRLTVNDDSIMLDLDANDYLGTFEGPLYVGGAPSKYLSGDMFKRNGLTGFTGCFRGLSINDKSIELRSYLSPSMPTVISGCQPSCTKNICQNDGKCIELWGNYECKCSNEIAHSGNNCEININTNSITFVTQAAYYVQQSNESSATSFPSYLTKNILLNLRTYQETALILYACDKYNNFIQLHKNGSSLVLTFNSNNTIIATQFPIDDDSSPEIAFSKPHQGLLVLSKSDSNTVVNQAATSISATTISSTSSIDYTQTTTRQSNATGTGAANASASRSAQPPPPSISILDRSIRVSNTSGSGRPIQVKIERHRLRTTFYVNKNFVIIEKPLIFLTNYSTQPWTNPELESVRPQRSKLATRSASRIYLANIDETYFATRLPGITGCIQGFSIDNQLFDFNRAHLTGDFKGEYRIGCKMHCDSFPCKNQGTCIENWKEDNIQCKCDTTSYVGAFCDEDVAAIFNGKSSFFVYRLPRKFSVPKYLSPPRLIPDSNSTEASAMLPSPSSATFASNVSSGAVAGDPQHKTAATDNGALVVEDFELSLAFSTDVNQTSQSNRGSSAVQVIAYVTRANSPLHFFLGLTSDGNLLIQEDYGHSMSLSRLIKKNDQPYNDGYRHMVKYSRHNQTIQIIVDYQTYLPQMSVISTNHVHSFSNTSLISVGTAGDLAANLSDNHRFDGNYTNYIGCISNLVIKIGDAQIEPLSEAFGQNLETVNFNASSNARDEPMIGDKSASIGIGSAKSAPANPNKQSERLILDGAQDDDYSSKIGAHGNAQSRILNVINKLDGKEVDDDIEPIVVRDVEQGKCASFKRSEVNNEKRSINEPKHTPLLDPRPVLSDDPKKKSYKRPGAMGVSKPGAGRGEINKGFGFLFYCSVAILVTVVSSFSFYAYILQARYKSEKFRCETPFFHRRDESSPQQITRSIDD